MNTPVPKEPKRSFCPTWAAIYSKTQNKLQENNEE